MVNDYTAPLDGQTPSEGHHHTFDFSTESALNVMPYLSPLGLFSGIN